MSQGNVLGQVVELVTSVWALVASLRVVKAEDVVSKFFHKMPTDVIAIGSFCEGHVTDGTLTTDIDSLRFVDE